MRQRAQRRLQRGKLARKVKGVARKPAHLSFAQAASLGVPYTTAWDALERSLVTAQTRLLVIGSGAVGSAALALAKIRALNEVERFVFGWTSGEVAGSITLAASFIRSGDHIMRLRGNSS